MDWCQWKFLLIRILTDIPNRQTFRRNVEVRVATAKETFWLIICPPMHSERSNFPSPRRHTFFLGVGNHISVLGWATWVSKSYGTNKKIWNSWQKRMLDECKNFHNINLEQLHGNFFSIHIELNWLRAEKIRSSLKASKVFAKLLMNHGVLMKWFDFLKDIPSSL